MSNLTLVVLGSSAGAGAGLLAGPIGLSGRNRCRPRYLLRADGLRCSDRCSAHPRRNILGRYPAGIDRLVSGSLAVPQHVVWGPRIAGGVTAAQMTPRPLAPRSAPRGLLRHCRNCWKHPHQKLSSTLTWLPMHKIIRRAPVIGLGWHGLSASLASTLGRRHR